jgi:hypothetical protein
MPPASTPRTFFWQLLAVVFVLGSFALPRTAAASALPVTGYAWSDNIGWISFSGTTPAYGVSEDSVTGALSGYAWSDNLGWITFNAAEVFGCPSGACAPTVNLSTGNITGWARACSVFASKSLCSGALDGNSGGWDGWIALSAGNGYAVTQNLSTCAWSGYAWGSDAVGTISMNGVSPAYGVTVTGCAPADLTAGPVSPTSATAGTATTFSSTISNTGAGSTGAGFTNLFQFDNDADHAAVTATMTDTSPTVAAGGTDVSQVSYTFSTPGTWYVRTCADNNVSFVGTITESNEGNNCGVWTAVTVASALSATLSADTYTIDQGQSSTLTWSSTAGATCGAAGGGTWLSSGSPASGSVSVSPLDTSNYQVHCIKGSDFVDSNIVTINVVLATASISARPTCINGAGSSRLSWATSQVVPGSCTVSSSPPSPPSVLSTQPTGTNVPVTVTAKTTYTIACTTGGGSSITKSVIVDVRSCWTEF